MLPRMLHVHGLAGSLGWSERLSDAYLPRSTASRAIESSIIDRSRYSSAAPVCAWVGVRSAAGVREEGKH